jgi:hypothetical protein
MKYTLISFYSEPEQGGTYYTEHATRLKAQCESLGIDNVIENIPTTGNYYTNTFLKPQFILSCMDRIKTPLLWIDADCSLLEVPNLDSFQGIDMGAINRGGHLPIFSHALFFNQTPAAKDILLRWNEISKIGSVQWKGTPKGDHDALVVALGEKKVNFKFIEQNFCQLVLAPKSIIKSKCLR